MLFLLLVALQWLYCCCGGFVMSYGLLFLLNWHGEGRVIVVVVLSWLIIGDSVLVCFVL